MLIKLFALKNFNDAQEFHCDDALALQVIPIENTELLGKIHQTFRVQYIQDVALPNQAVFEENMPSTLSSFIFFNKVEIVSLIQVILLSFNTGNVIIVLNTGNGIIVF